VVGDGQDGQSRRDDPRARDELELLNVLRMAIERGNAMLWCHRDRIPSPRALFVVTFKIPVKTRLLLLELLQHSTSSKRAARGA
jgi:hypothetical protein